jgi:hypothetical protein
MNATQQRAEDEAQAAKLAKIKMIAASVVVLLVIGWMGSQWLPVVAPGLFVHEDSGPPPRPPGLPPPPPPAPSEGSPESTATDALSEVELEFPAEKVDSDPLRALARFERVAAENSGTQAGGRAHAKAEEIRKKFSGKVDAATAAALDEIAKKKATIPARLDRLEHTDVTLEWRELERKFVAYPAAYAACKAERESAQSAWNALPKEEKDARAAYLKLPKSDPTDDGDRFQVALKAQEIATTCSATKAGGWAAARRDTLLDLVASSIELKAQTNAKAARAVAKQLPPELKDAPGGKKITELYEQLREDQ